jgi:hypothetical protein
MFGKCFRLGGAKGKDDIIRQQEHTSIHWLTTLTHGGNDEIFVETEAVIFTLHPLKLPIVILKQPTSPLATRREIK